MTQPNDGPKRSNNILIAVLALIGLVLLIAFLKPNPIKDTNEDEESPAMEQRLISLQSMTPESWNGLLRAEKNIQSLQKGQVITPNIILDPNDSQIVYFATSAFDPTTEENSVGIYKYRLDNYTFERIYKETRITQPEINLPAQSIYLAGIDGQKLILMNDRQGFIPQNCAQLIALPLNETRQFKELDLNDPYGNWETFTPSSSLIDAAKEQQSECESLL